MAAAPVLGEGADRLRNVLRRRLDFLKADDVRLFARNPLRHLPGAGANTIHVPRDDLHAGFRSGLGSRSGPGSGSGSGFTRPHKNERRSPGGGGPAFLAARTIDATRGLLAWALLLLLEFSVHHIILLRRGAGLSFPLWTRLRARAARPPACRSRRLA